MKNLGHHSKKDLKGQSLSEFLLWDFPRNVTVSPRQLPHNLQKVIKDKIEENETFVQIVLILTD